MDSVRASVAAVAYGHQRVPSPDEGNRRPEDWRTEVRISLEAFSAGHYKVKSNVAESILQKKALEGGDDCTKCPFGVWRAQQKLENPDLIAATAAIEDPHRKFHESVKTIRELVAANDCEQAGKVFQEVTSPAAEDVVAQFRKMADVAEKSTEMTNIATKQAMEVCRASQLKANDLLNKIIQINNDVAADATKQASTNSTSSLVAMFSAIGIGALVLLVIGVLLARSISKVLTALIGEATRLSAAAVEGKLQTRGNPELVSLEFRPIVDGVNATLDAVIGPLKVAAEYVDRISKGDIPAKITDTYNGDFNEIKNNLNRASMRSPA